MTKRALRIVLSLLPFIFTMSCQDSLQNVEDRKPTLTVSITPEEWTDFSQIKIIITAEDDQGLSGVKFYFPTLKAGRSTFISPIEAKSLKRLNETDSLVPDLLSEEDIKKLGDTLIFEVSVYDFPHNQETKVEKVIKLGKR